MSGVVGRLLRGRSKDLLFRVHCYELVTLDLESWKRLYRFTLHYLLLSCF